jgi:hypothetical protein
VKRIDKIQHALWHLAHGVFPSVKFLERRVSTPDFDHIRDTKKFKSRDYLPHLVMNLKAAVRHLVEALLSFLEVKIK